MKLVKYGVNKNTGYEFAIAEISYHANMYELWTRKKGYIDNWAMDAKGSLDRMIEILNIRINEQKPNNKYWLDWFE